MFRKKKQLKEIQTKEEPIKEAEQIEKSIEVEDEKPIASSIAIKDLEVGKLYYRVEIQTNDIKFVKVLIESKGANLDVSHPTGWLSKINVEHFVSCYETDVEGHYTYNGDLNDLLEENHNIIFPEYYGPFHDAPYAVDVDCHIKNVFYFNTNSDITTIKNVITTYWEKLRDEELEDQKKHYAKLLEDQKKELDEERDYLNSRFNKIMKEIQKNTLDSFVKNKMECKQ